MNHSPFLESLRLGRPLVSDGATGSNLFARGLPQGSTPEEWVLEQPDQIIRLHQDFIASGSDIILTCTFGATSLRLAGSPIADRAVEVNQRAVALARQAVGASSVWVGGSLGPVGGLLKPYGPLDIDTVLAAYAEQARTLAEAGVDLLVIETQFDLGEAKAAIQGVRSITDLPLVCSFSYDRGRRTMMGLSPAQAARQVTDMGVDLIGVNCGRSLEDNLQNLLELRQATDLPIWFKPNAGLPHIDEQNRTTYSVTPAEMAAQVSAWLDAGAQIVGGCCGTTPEHLAHIARAAKPV